MIDHSENKEPETKGEGVKSRNITIKNRNDDKIKIRKQKRE